jgi:hypothetical protein
MYSYTWKKYLPVIRLFIKRASATEQVLSLNRTDFERTTKTRKPACSFHVEIIRGRFSNVNQSLPAKNLLDVLMEDPLTKALLRQHHYAISLNSDFKLSITNCTPPPEVEELVEENERSGI